MKPLWGRCRCGHVPFSAVDKATHEAITCPLLGSRGRSSGTAPAPVVAAPPSPAELRDAVGMTPGWRPLGRRSA